MEIFRPGGKEYTYTAEELDRAIETLLAAEEIKKDDKFYKLCLDEMEKKKKKITQIQDIRDAYNEKAEGNSERKRL